MSSSESIDHLIFNQTHFPEYNGHSRVEKLRVLKDPGQSSLPQNEGRIEVQGLSASACSQWLRTANKQGEKPCASMNILLVRTHNQLTAKHTVIKFPGTLQKRERPQTPQRVQDAQFLRDVFSETQLPLAGLASYVKTLITFASVPSRSGSPTADETRYYSYYCSGPSWCVSWTYAPESQLTSAVLLYREGDGEERANEVVRELYRLRGDMDHPLLLGYIRTKISISLTFSLLLEMNFETQNLEKESGLSTWNWALEREIPGSGVPENHDRSVDRFSALSGKTTNTRFRLRALQEQIRFLIRCNRRHQRAVRKDKAAIRKCEELHEMMQVMSEYTSVYLYDADSLGERLTNQMTSIFNLTGQKDSRAGIAIAKDSRKLAVQSKRDSSSMKTIAVVTLFFLPGTFVAAFFGTPMFNWDASSNGSVVSPRFWVFWAVSVPLTILICLSWLWWYGRKSDESEREQEAEQIELGKAINGPRRSSSLSTRRPVIALRRHLEARMGRPHQDLSDEESGRSIHDHNNKLE